jgi:hypothetical protein
VDGVQILGMESEILWESQKNYALDPEQRPLTKSISKKGNMLVTRIGFATKKTLNPSRDERKKS